MDFLEKYKSQRELVKDGKDTQIYLLDRDVKFDGKTKHAKLYTIIFKNKIMHSYYTYEDALDDWNYLELGI